MSAPGVLLVGAGALGLGFLAERLAGECELTLADRYERRDLLERIEREGGYSLTLCGPTGATTRRVEGRFRAAFTDDPAGPAGFEEAVARSPIILTATGGSVLPHLVPVLASAVRAAGGEHTVFFCENGVGIAARYGPALGPAARAMDTVMSRMCRFADQDEERYEPLWPGSPHRLVAEEYAFIPVAEPAPGVQAAAGGVRPAGRAPERAPLPRAFTAMRADRFGYWQDVKVYMHNAMHAFVAYHDALEGVHSAAATPERIRDAARAVMMDEMVPAVSWHHRWADAAGTERYGQELLGRFYSPWFADSVERGIRGTADKLAPGGRLRGWVDYIREAGIEPAGFTAVVAAAERVLARREEPGAGRQ